jgi:hypothetical protein
VYVFVRLVVRAELQEADARRVNVGEKCGEGKVQCYDVLDVSPEWWRSAKTNSLIIDLSEETTIRDNNPYDHPAAEMVDTSEPNHRWRRVVRIECLR